MRKRYIAAVVGIVAASVLAMSGCQSQKYEKVVLEQTAEIAEEEVPQAEGSAQKVDLVGTAGTANGPTVSETTAAAETAQIEESQVAQAATSETVYVTADDVNLRAQASATGSVVSKLSRGTELTRTGTNDSWSVVVYHGQTCYIATDYISKDKPAETTAAAQTAGIESAGASASAGAVGLNSSWKYAGYSKINSGTATLYKSEASNRKGKVVCVNAGHGTNGGGSVKTQCHPDGTAKVTGGTTSAGATTAVAVSGGMTFADGTAEAKVTLALAKVLKDKLLARGYDVLMIRESDDVQLDNVARTVIANNMADCHIALHWDSTTSNKGAFYMSVPNVTSYRSMEPVASNWKKHHALGDHLITGLKGAGVKIFSSGKMDMDLTQTSYSTIPSVDIELGDKSSDHSAATLDKLGSGLADGIESFFA